MPAAARKAQNSDESLSAPAYNNGQVARSRHDCFAREKAVGSTVQQRCADRQ